MLKWREFFDYTHDYFFGVKVKSTQEKTNIYGFLVKFFCPRNATGKQKLFQLIYAQEGPLVLKKMAAMELAIRQASPEYVDYKQVVSLLGCNLFSEIQKKLPTEIAAAEQAVSKLKNSDSIKIFPYPESAIEVANERCRKLIEISETFQINPSMGAYQYSQMKFALLAEKILNNNPLLYVDGKSKASVKKSIEEYLVSRVLWELKDDKPYRAYVARDTAYYTMILARPMRASGRHGDSVSAPGFAGNHQLVTFKNVIGWRVVWPFFYVACLVDVVSKILFEYPARLICLGVNKLVNTLCGVSRDSFAALAVKSVLNGLLAGWLIACRFVLFSVAKCMSPGGLKETLGCQSNAIHPMKNKLEITPSVILTNSPVSTPRYSESKRPDTFMLSGEVPLTMQTLKTSDADIENFLRSNTLSPPGRKTSTPVLPVSVSEPVPIKGLYYVPTDVGDLCAEPLTITVLAPSQCYLKIPQ